MKLMIPIILVVIVLAAIGGYLYLNPQLVSQLFKTTPPMKDCGTDVTCFGDAFLNCTPAKVSMNLLVLEMTEQINGLSDSNCLVYAKITNATNSSWVGLDMNCRFPVSKLSTGLSEDPENYCTGSLLTFIRQQS